MRFKDNGIVDSGCPLPAVQFSASRLSDNEVLLRNVPFQGFVAVFRAQPRGDVAPAAEFVSSDATAVAKLARWHLVPVACQQRRAQMAR